MNGDCKKRGLTNSKLLTASGNQFTAIKQWQRDGYTSQSEKFV